MTGLRIVLVRPQFAGNLGAIARVMHNFGCSQLFLLDPQADPCDPEARRMATRGDFILQQARRVFSLDEAFQGSRLTAATSANIQGVVRQTGLFRLRELAPRIASEACQGTVAIVFGPEPHGLTTAEIDRCHFLLSIPTHPNYPSLNLAQAVAIVLYEIGQAPGISTETRSVAPYEDLHRAMLHLRKGLEAIHFLYGPKADPLMHAIRHLICRAQPSPAEVKILHGLARQLLWVAQRGLAGEGHVTPEKDTTSDRQS